MCSLTESRGGWALKPSCDRNRFGVYSALLGLSKKSQSYRCELGLAYNNVAKLNSTESTGPSMEWSVHASHGTGTCPSATDHAFSTGKLRHFLMLLSGPTVCQSRERGDRWERTFLQSTLHWRITLHSQHGWNVKEEGFSVLAPLAL